MGKVQKRSAAKGAVGAKSRPKKIAPPVKKRKVAPSAVKKPQKTPDTKRKRSDSSDSRDVKKRNVEEQGSEAVNVRTRHKGGTLHQCKVMWEKIRDSRVEDKTKIELIGRLLSLIDGHILEVILKHDGSRMIQSCLAHGDEQQRQKVYKELQGHYIFLSKKSYARHLVCKAMKIAKEEQFSKILDEFRSNIRSLMKHKEASEVVEFGYKLASPLQRCQLMEEFYGAEFALFKTDKKRQLSDVLKDSPEKKEGIIRHLKESMVKQLNKGIVHHTLIHAVLLQFYQNADAQSIRDVTAILAPLAVELVRSKEGSLVAGYCVGYADAGERKRAIKALKNDVVNVAKEEHGHMLILKMLASTDDTVLLNKGILKILTEDLDDVVFHKKGRLSILQVLCPGKASYFSPQHKDLLKRFETVDADGNTISTSKKPDETRTDELRKHLKKKLIPYCAESAQKLLCSEVAWPVILETCLALPDDASPIFKNVVCLAKEEFGAATNDHVLKNQYACRVLKWLIKSGPESFVSSLADTFLNETKEKVLHCNASFVLLSILHRLPNHKAKTAAKKHEKLMKKAPGGPQKLIDAINQK